MSDEPITGELDASSTAGGVTLDPRAEGDLGDALERERAFAAVRRGLLGEEAAAAPSRIGRFVVRRRLGAGAMGMVYEAHDDALDRGIAVKLLRTEDERGAAGRARLLREAQTLAKLRHPNVVAVHEVGEHEGRVYVAMELVEGTDLRAWSKEAPRRWPEIVACFVEAGRGLAAAHAAGLVHRDFKPDNVLVGRDGSVRVADFGLARPRDDDSLDGEITLEASGELVGDRLTRTGALLGTPAYMAPELFAGKPASPHSDQFAFCVALFEAVHGTRPFQGRTVLSLVTEIVEGRIDRTTKRPDVPAWLDRIVERGLAGEPAARWPDMPALVSALRRERRRRRVRYGIGATALAGTIGIGFALGHVGTTARCAGFERQLEAVWNASTRREIGEAFMATGHPEAQRMLGRTTAGLDAFATAWAERRREACVASDVRGERSQVLHDRQVACLERAEDTLAAAVELLRDASSEVVTRADALVPDVQIVEDCAERSVLAAGVPMPADPELRGRLRATEAEVARAAAARAAGDLPRAIRIAEGAVETAQTLGHAPTLARARYQLGAALGFKRETLDSLGPLREALVAAEEGLADLDRHFIHLTLARRYVDLQRIDEARASASLAEAVLHRVGGGDASRAVEVEMMWGYVEHEAGDFAAAEARYTAALDLATGVGNEDLEAYALQALGSLKSQRGEAEAALELLLRARARYDESRGPRHPDVAKVLVTIGAVQIQLGRLDDADASFRESLSIQREYVEADDPVLASVYANLGVVAYQRGQLDDALDWYGRALAGRERGGGHDSVEAARVLTNMAYVHARQGDLEGALAEQQRALRLRREALGEAHPSIGDAHYHVALTLFRLKRYEEALASYERSRDVLLGVYGAEHPESLTVVVGITECLLELGRAAEAVPMLETAIADGDLDAASAPIRAGLEFNLARALAAVEPGARASPRARALAQAAGDRLADVAGAQDEVATIRGWLAEAATPSGPEN